MRHVHREQAQRIPGQGTLSHWMGCRKFLLGVVIFLSWPISGADKSPLSVAPGGRAGGASGDGRIGRGEGGGGGGGGGDMGPRGGKGPSWLQSQRLFRAERVSLFLRGPSASDRYSAPTQSHAVFSVSLSLSPCLSHLHLSTSLPLYLSRIHVQFEEIVEH